MTYRQAVALRTLIHAEAGKDAVLVSITGYGGEWQVKVRRRGGPLTEGAPLFNGAPVYLDKASDWPKVRQNWGH